MVQPNQAARRRFLLFYKWKNGKGEKENNAPDAARQTLIVLCWLQELGFRVMVHVKNKPERRTVKILAHLHKRLAHAAIQRDSTIEETADTVVDLRLSQLPKQPKPDMPSQ